MPPRILALCLALFGLSWAAEVWETIPFTHWVWKDIDHILTDSPWCRSISVVPDLEQVEKLVPKELRRRRGAAPTGW